MIIDTQSQPLKDRIENALADFTSGRASMHVPPLDTDVDVVLAECSSALEAAESHIAELEARDINIKQQAQALFEAISNPSDHYVPAYVRCLREALNGSGISVKGE